jgi:hypothetical protein
MHKRVALVVGLAFAILVAPAVLADDDDDEHGEHEVTGLVVDRVTLGAAGPEGIEIELRYWLVNVDQLPGHPSKTTLIMDEETNEGVMIRKLQPIASSISDDDMAETPPAILEFRDDRGVIRPGKPVSVAVAGLVAKHVVPEAGPDYEEGGIAKARERADQEARRELPEDAALEVIGVTLGGEGGLLHVRFRTRGVGEITADGEHTYVLDPETGDRFEILRVPRLGLMAPKHLGDYDAGSYLVIRVPSGRFHRGDKISVIVEGLRQDNVVVE